MSVSLIRTTSSSRALSILLGNTDLTRLNYRVAHKNALRRSSNRTVLEAIIVSILALKHVEQHNCPIAPST